MNSHLPEVTRRMVIAGNEVIKTNPSIKDMKTFAEAIGSDKVRASLWKSGKGNVTVDNMINAYIIFGISLYYLAVGTGEIFISHNEHVSNLVNLLKESRKTKK